MSVMNTTDLKPVKSSLGRGLSALLGENLLPEIEEETSEQSFVRRIATTLIRPGKYQPRRTFNDEKLQTLILSVQEKGILQPLIVRPLTEDLDGPYEIIAGERRWRAAKTLNLETVPAIIRLCSDREALETALIENVQRDDLSPVEEAEAYQRLMSEFNYTQEELAQSISKSRSHVANMLRLNNLPTYVKELIDQGKISAGHARTLITAPDVDQMVQQILEGGLNVRQAEKLAKSKKNPTLDIPPSETDFQIKHLEQEIQQALGLKAHLKVTKSGGVLTMHFNSYEEIDEFLEKIKGQTY
jgi:ParB family transcriptional regulator, chromosome partitioning protein